jgi:integrase
MGLGSLKGVSLATARQLAEEARAVIQRGGDPIDERKAKRAAAAAARTSVMTFKEASGLYTEKHEDEWRSDVHRQQFKRSLEIACETLGHIDVKKVTTLDVVRVLKPIWKRTPVSAERLRNRIERVLRSYSGVEPNPAKWDGVLEHHLSNVKKTAKAKKTSFAAMQYADVPAYVSELSAETSMPYRALLFTVLTAVRSAEALGARWSEIDINQATWTIPKTRTKTGVEHVVPLSRAATELLRSLPESGDFVFPGRVKGTPIHRAAMQRIVPDGVTVHGFRTSFRTWCSEQTNVSFDAAEMSLGHVVGNTTERTYQRSKLFAKRARLMEMWGKYCTTPLVAGEVVKLHG